MVQFTDEDPSLGFQGRVCGGSRLRTSYYLCMRTYCTPSEGDDGADEVKKTCREVLAGEEVPGMESVAGYTDEEVENLPKFGRMGFEGADGKLDMVVVPDATFFGLWFDTLVGDIFLLRRSWLAEILCYRRRHIISTGITMRMGRLLPFPLPVRASGS
jgi:hypothetical protein